MSFAPGVRLDDTDLSVRAVSSVEINTLLAYGYIVEVEKRTIYVTEQIVIPSGGVLRLNGATLDFSNYSGSAPMIYCAGTAGTPVLLSSNAAAAQADVVVTSAATFAVGDMVRIYSTSVYDLNRTDSLCGELGVIKAIAGTTLTLELPLSDSYGTADAAAVEPIVCVENVSIVGPGTIVGNPTAQSTEDGIYFWRARNCSVEGIRFQDIDTAQLVFRDSMHCRGFRNYHGRARPSTLGYGVSFRDATQDCRVDMSTFDECRHAMTTNNTAAYGGIPRRITFAGNIVQNSAFAAAGTGGDAIDTHAAADDIFILDNIIRGASLQGINVECRRAVVRGNDISGCLSNGIGYHNETHRSGSVDIRGNRIRNCAGKGVTVTNGNASGAGGMERVLVADNDIADVTDVGINIVGSSALPFLDVGMSGNVVARAANTVAATLLTWCSPIMVGGNRVICSSTTQSGIRTTDCASGAVADNVITLASASAAQGVRFGATSTMAVSTTVGGNVVKSASPAGSEGLYWDTNISGLVLGVNDLRDCSTPVSGSAAVSTTIASDAITLTNVQPVHALRVDTEGSAAADNLATINGGIPGEMLVLMSVSNARVVTVKNGTGNIRLSGADFVLDNGRDTLTLVKSGVGSQEWYQIGSGNNG